MDRYTKTIPNGEKPKPYKEKIENFFATIDVEWLSSLRKAYTNVDIDTELGKAKMWLLSNSPKRNLKKFVNNWMAKAMGNRDNNDKERVMFGEYQNGRNERFGSLFWENGISKRNSKSV